MLLDIFSLRTIVSYIVHKEEDYVLEHPKPLKTTCSFMTKKEISEFIRKRHDTEDVTI